MSVAVKICGLMTPEHAVAAVQASADYIGLVFAVSRRQVDLLRAREIVAAARAAQPPGTSLGVVGVFVNAQPATINAIVADVGLDYVQLSGHEDISIAAMINAPVIKAIRFDDDPSEAAWLAEQDRSESYSAPLLVDAHVAGSYGGAGITADWRTAADLAQRRRVWLAGGLHIENVADAIRQVQPLVVDVSSGVETHGIKDRAKIEAFIRAAKGIVTGQPA